MSAWRHLLVAGLWSLRRDPACFLMFPMALGMGLLVPTFSDEIRQLFSPEDSSTGSSSSGTKKSGGSPCAPDDATGRALAVEGNPPTWFSWYEPLVSVEEADVVATFVGDGPHAMTVHHRQIRMAHA